MKKLIIPLACLFLLTSVPHISLAQFEGKVAFKISEIEGGSERDSHRFAMFVTPERILLQGKEQYKVVGSIKSRGLLIRMDFEDFVFYTEEDKALKISKSNISAMLNMAGVTGNKPVVDREVKYQNTGKTKNINGYACELYVFQGEGKEEGRVEVWLTKELDINWGMLGNSWGDSLTELMGGDSLPTRLIFKESYFPLLVEIYESNELTGRMEAEEVSSSSIARAMVKIPSGVKVLSFEEYLFQSYGN